MAGLSIRAITFTCRCSGGSFWLAWKAFSNSCLLYTSGKFSLPKTLDNIVDIFIHNLTRYAEGLPLDNQVNRTTRDAADQNGGHRLLSTL